jgi:hypothetical protein
MNEKTKRNGMMKSLPTSSHTLIASRKNDRQQREVTDAIGRTEITKGEELMKHRLIIGHNLIQARQAGGVV